MILVREVLDCLAIIAIYHISSLVCGFLVGVVHCYTFSSDVMFLCIFVQMDCGHMDWCACESQVVSLFPVLLLYFISVTPRPPPHHGHFAE